MQLRVERVESPESWAEISQEWEVLGSQIFPRTPFTSPLWIALWWRHMRRRRLSLRDEFFGHVVRDADDRLIAVAPLMLKKKRRASDPPRFGRCNSSAPT